MTKIVVHIQHKKCCDKTHTHTQLHYIIFTFKYTISKLFFGIPCWAFSESNFVDHWKTSNMETDQNLQAMPIIMPMVPMCGSKFPTLQRLWVPWSLRAVRPGLQLFGITAITSPTGPMPPNTPLWLPTLQSCLDQFPISWRRSSSFRVCVKG